MNTDAFYVANRDKVIENMMMEFHLVPPDARAWYENFIADALDKQKMEADILDRADDGLYADAISGDVDATAELEMKADKLGEYGETILHNESRKGNTEHVRFILKEFASKNLLVKLSTEKYTALHMAAYTGQTEVVEVLIDAARHLPSTSDSDDPVTSFHAFLRQGDKDMNTALHGAVMYNHVAVVKLLVEADPTDRHNQNNEGETPMYIAVEKGFDDIVEIISTTCTDPSFDGPDGSAAVRIKNLDQAKSSGGTLYKIWDRNAFYEAAVAGDADAIAKFEMEDDETILHIESRGGNTERLRFILREFANKNLLTKLTTHKQTALHIAAYNGHTEVAEVLINAARHLPPSDDDNPVTSFQAFLRQGDNNMDTALHGAVMNGYVDIVKLLVEADPSDTHIQNDEGKTPMYIAVEEGYNDIVEIIYTTCTAPSLDGPNGTAVRKIRNLDQGKNTGGTLYEIFDIKDALFEDAIAGDADAIAKLEMEADRVNKDEETILHVESKKGNTEHVRFILREFADKNLLVKLDNQKETALTWAAYYGHTEVVEVLIDAARHLPPSANDNTHDHPVVSSFQAFLRQGDKDMDTALHTAVMCGHVAIVKLLVEADPTDKHIPNDEGKTPIYIAAEKGYNEIVRLICTSCTAQSLDGPHGTTALHAAARNRDHGSEVVEVLIEAARLLSSSSDDDDNTHSLVGSFQAFLRQGDEDWNTALHIAVISDNVAIAKLLVEADPSDRHAQNKEGKTPIYIAAESREESDMVKVICTTCTSPCFDGPGGSTALHAAIKNFFQGIEVVEVLIGAARHLSSDDDQEDEISYFQAFLRQGDEDLNTALHIALIKGERAAAKLLVEADPSDGHTQNKEGKTPMYIAVEEGYNDIVKLICTTCTAPSLDGPGGSSALHAAIKNLDQGKKEDNDVIKVIIDAVKSAYLPNYYGTVDKLFNKVDENRCSTILELAVEGNYLELVGLILEIQTPAYQNAVKPHFLGLLPLYYRAMDKEYKDIANLLMESFGTGAVNTIRYETMVDFISSIGDRQKERALTLLANNARGLVTFADNIGWTALHHAAYHEFDSIIYGIIEAQKKCGQQFVYENMVSTPFHVAAEKGHTSTVILLMELWPSSSSAIMIQGILKYCSEEYKNELVNKQDNDGNTPLHLLMRCGCFVPELLRYEGLDIRVENAEKWTAPDMLYFEDQIIENQVQIKIVLDHIQIKEQKDIFSSSVLPSKRMRKDEIFHKQAELMKLQKHAQIKEDSHAISKCFADAIAGDPISKAALEMEGDTQNQDGKTILHIESMRGDIERVRYIVREFANGNILVKLDNVKQTALHIAAYHGHTQLVELLIDAARHLPSSANDRNHNPISSFQDFIGQSTGPAGNTALHLAVLNGNLAIVKLLVEANQSDSHVQNNEGKTPIYIAAENGYKDIVREICRTCTVLSLDGPWGSTTVLHALIHNMGRVTQEASDLIRMILVNATKRWSSEDYEALFCRTDELGRTILQVAIERNNVDAVKLILVEDPAYQHGPEIKRNGLMSLIYKVIDNEYSEDIIKSLSETYQTGIHPEHKDVLELILAIKKRDEDSVLRLLRVARELVTFKEDNGWTPLHYAVYHEFDSILGAIIEAQEVVGHPFVYGNMVSTPFHVAVKYGYTSTLLLLMQLWPALSSASTAANSPYTVVNKDGQNILHLAAADNRKEMVQGILKYCPEEYKDQILKHQDNSGNTPLHLLISHGCFIPELIKHKGLDTMAKNKNNFTPRDMLYDQNDVVADQVHIKIVLDALQTNQSGWNLWAKSKEKKNDMWKSTVVTPSKQRIKDVIFDEQKKLVMDAKHEQKKKELERYKMRTNTQIIVTALITTVTFTVGFTMPGGLYQSGDVDEGLVVLSRKAAFNAFMVSDALALLLSTSSLFFYFLESMNEDPRQVSKLNAASAVLNIVSVMAMMLTFIAGTYVVLSHSPALAITVCFIGSLFFLLIIVLSIKAVYDRKVKRNED